MHIYRYIRIDARAHALEFSVGCLCPGGETFPVAAT